MEACNSSHHGTGVSLVVSTLVANGVRSAVGSMTHTSYCFRKSLGQYDLDREIRMLDLICVLARSLSDRGYLRWFRTGKSQGVWENLEYEFGKGAPSSRAVQVNSGRISLAEYLRFISCLNGGPSAKRMVCRGESLVVGTWLRNQSFAGRVENHYYVLGPILYVAK
jgi:hypothetical protein